MRAARWTWALLLLVMLAGLLAACEKKETEPTASEWIARGKDLLEKGDGASAYLAFQEALKIRSGDLQAHYGVVLADVQQFAETIALLTSLTAGTDDAAATPPDQASAICQKLDACGLLELTDSSYAECLQNGGYAYDAETRECIQASPDCDVLMNRCIGVTLPPSDEQCSAACVRFASCGFFADSDWQSADCVRECLQLYTAAELVCFVATDDCESGRKKCFPYEGETISTLVDQFWTPIGEEMQRSIEAVQGHPDFLFKLDYYTVALIPSLFQPVFSGYHDESDLYFFAGIASGMSAVFSLVESLNLDINPMLLASLGLDQFLNMMSEGDGGLADLVDFLAQIEGVIDQILNDPIYGDGLKLAEEEGAEDFTAAGVQLGEIFGAFATTIEMVAKETDDQTDDVIRYVDRNGDGQWDDDEPLLVPGIVEMDYELSWIVHDLLVALKVAFADGYPFRFEDLTPLLNYSNLQPISLLITLLDLAGIDSIDLGAAFRDPSPDGLRPLLADIQQLVLLIEDLTAGG
jgi:hypothetical protein